MRAVLLSLLLSTGWSPLPGSPGPEILSETPPRSIVQGITISCQTWGREWGDPRLDDELDELADLGVNWISIHPYARIHDDGRVTFRSIDPAAPPEWLVRPIRAAHERGMGILIKPHLAYWGSGFSWRGEIAFAEPDVRARFFRDYEEWIVSIARATKDADAFAIGTELEGLVEFEQDWRAVIASVRGATEAQLTYAANWTEFERVGFWDTLDAVGVQAYFPLSESSEPADEDLRAGWRDVLARLRRVHEASGKPVVFTELGYNRSLDAARLPWSNRMTSGTDAGRATQLQLRCFALALEVLEAERDWLRGAFLWKWFVGEVGRHDQDFLLDTPAVREVIARSWSS